ncbi:MAG: hypothetical protein BWY76_01382 [bacterium ADurb.Bin429]|nr:MAG: hypothetical protein BWY76_01382 [bacterium ADurb.Bin429]
MIEGHHRRHPGRQRLQRLMREAFPLWIKAVPDGGERHRLSARLQRGNALPRAFAEADHAGHHPFGGTQFAVNEGIKHDQRSICQALGGGQRLGILQELQLPPARGMVQILFHHSIRPAGDSARLALRVAGYRVANGGQRIADRAAEGRRHPQQLPGEGHLHHVASVGLFAVIQRAVYAPCQADSAALAGLEPARVIAPVALVAALHGHPAGGADDDAHAVGVENVAIGGIQIQVDGDGVVQPRLAHRCRLIADNEAVIHAQPKIQRGGGPRRMRHDAVRRRCFRRHGGKAGKQQEYGKVMAHDRSRILADG